MYHVGLPCLLQNETEQNSFFLFVDAFTLTSMGDKMLN